MLKKSSFVILCVIVMMFGSSIEVRANEDVVGAEVTVEPENQFTSYRTPEEDVICYELETDTQEVDVDEDVKMDTSVENSDYKKSIEEELLDESDREKDAKADEREEKIKINEESLTDEEIKYLDVVPQTGDASNLVFWGILLVVALGATIGLGIYLLKKK